MQFISRINISPLEALEPELCRVAAVAALEGTVEAIANVVGKCCKCSINPLSIDMQRGLSSFLLISLSFSLSLSLFLSFSRSLTAYSSLGKAATATGQGGGPTLGAS